MSVNETMDFESINQKTSERRFVEETEGQCKEEIQRVEKAKAKTKALARYVLTLIAMGVALVGINLLENIGWINSTFCVVLMCLTGAVAMYKCGYLWHEIKN